MKKVLCPVDLRPDTLNALEAAAHIAAAHKAQLLLLHVLTEGEYDDALSAGEGDLRRVEALEQSQQAAMDRLCDTLRSSIPALQCSSLLRYGSAIATILNEAKNQRCNLIVMGSHGVRDITEAMDGNHPVKVIERAPCPVICVPEGASFEAPARVVYGSRLKPEDPDCLQRLTALLLPFGSRIDVVYVGESGEADQQKWLAHQRLIKSYVPYEKMRFSHYPTEDEVYQGLDAYMHESGADMLVLLTHQRNFFQRLFQKSVFKQITYFSDYPLMVYLEDHLAAAETKADLSDGQ